MELIGRKVLIASIIVSLAIGFGGGFLFAHKEGNGAVTAALENLINQDLGKPNDVDFSLFWQVWTTLRDRYVDQGKLNTRAMVYGAIQGMVGAVGDPYTTFFEPVESKKFEEDIAGAFSGVGMEIGKRDGALVVISPLKDSPAMKAGLKAGDRILRINEESTEGISVEEAVKQIRGPKGTKVTLTINSGTDSETREVTIVRDVIKVAAATWKMLDGDIAYIELTTFSQNLDREFENIVKEITQSKAKKIIVDLRNNPGGLLDSSVTTAGWFLSRNSLVTIQEFGDKTRREYRTDGNAALREYPTAFMINGGSASASEILAGAVHDNRGITLVGEKSFGKGSVQELEKFSDGSSLKVTIAKWLTPNGVSISETGIEADVKIAIDPEAFKKGEITIGEPGKDPQLDRAIKIVNNP
ncbi:MAG: S41 family peptidase [Patescibacteria group bacterium]|mgnify:CR=1 FL=1